MNTCEKIKTNKQTKTKAIEIGYLNENCMVLKYSTTARALNNTIDKKVRHELLWTFLSPHKKVKFFIDIKKVHIH